MADEQQTEVNTETLEKQEGAFFRIEQLGINDRNDITPSVRKTGPVR